MNTDKKTASKKAPGQLSERARRVLQNHNIENIELLAKLTADDLLGWKDLGRCTLEEILSEMKRCNVVFRENKECPNLEYDEEFKEYICHGGCNEECPIPDPFSCPATVDAYGNPLHPNVSGLDSETEMWIFKRGNVCTNASSVDMRTMT